MNELENIKRRVKKLLTLSKSPNENEAYSALKKAHELMEEYKLSVEQCSEYIKQNIKSTKRHVPWRIILANAVENLYATYHYRDSEGNLVFYGEELDVFMSSEMYKYLVRTIDRMAVQNIHKNAKYKYRQSYRTGIASRLYTRMCILGQECSWRNLKELKAQQKQIRDFVESQIFLITHKQKKVKVNRAAFVRGANDADRINLSRQMTGSGGRMITGR